MDGYRDFDFKIYRSNRLDNFLPEVLGIIRKLSGKYPLKKKSIVVQSDGMARWLTLKAASESGAFANFEFVSPDKFLKDFAEKHFRISQKSVYSKKNAEWALYSILRSPNSGADTEKNDLRAFSMSRILADLFEQYFVYRPKMMASWLAGTPESGDPDEKWQSEIFSGLAEGKGMQLCSFAELFNEKCMKADASIDSPMEVILFGISIMNSCQLGMFLNLSRLVPVRLFAVSPSSEFFDSVSNNKGDFNNTHETSGISAETPDTFFRRFCAAGLEFVNFTAENLPDETDLSEKPDGKTMLASIQRDILNDTETPEKVADYDPDKDDSVKIAACRDKMREIEVVKDFLLDLFNKDASLKPEEVAVMAPKINDYIPYITSVFGNTPPDDETFIPWVVSDRTFADESRIASTFLEMLGLCGSDFEKSKVFSIFNSPLVCAKFNTDEKTAAGIEQIVTQSGVRWGLDADSRNGECAVHDQNTWDFGLSRIMMTFAMPFSETGEKFRNIQPLPHASKETLETLSGFVTFAKELFRRLELLSSSDKSPSEFKNILEEMLDFFFLKDYNDKNSVEEMRHIRSVIDDFAETAGKYSSEISFKALRQYLTEELGRERSGKGFLSAKVNFCSLKPMRALPFKVICLIGMGDNSFPRSENRYSFDLTRKLSRENAAPVPRSVRDNDKYLFVEAVVSAREKLFISYDAGALSEDSKKHRSPSLPVEILKKYIGTKSDKKPDEKTPDPETKYPVYPFSQEYFEKDSKFRTFSKKDFETAKMILHTEQPQQNPALEHLSAERTDSCGEVKTETADFEQFAAFFRDPIRNYFKNNLKITLPDNKSDTGDTELFDYSDPLTAYSARETYIKTALIMPDEFEEKKNFINIFAGLLKSEGSCPFGAIGKAELAALFDPAECAAANEGLSLIAGKDLGFKDFSLDFAAYGVKLKGRITNIDWKNRYAVLVFPVSKLGTKYQIEALVRHLTANACGLALSTRLYGFGADKNSFTLDEMPENEALSCLTGFVKLWNDAKTVMPLFDPGLIEKLYSKSDKYGELDLSRPAIAAEITAFFSEKLQKKGTSYSYASPELLLGAEQFMLQGERLLANFPEQNIREICRLMARFYPKKGSKETK